MCTIMEKDALVEKASRIADEVIKATESEGEGESNPNLRWILATRQFLLVNTHEMLDFSSWANILGEFEKQYERKKSFI